MRPFIHRRGLLVAAASVLIVGAVAAACASEASVASEETLSAQAGGAPAARDMASKDVAIGMALGAAATWPTANFAESPPPPAPPPAVPVSQGPTASAPAMLIRNGDVSIQVDSLEAAMTAVRRLAASLGGHIGNVSVAGGEHQVRSATLEMRIPVARFDDAMAGVAPIGRVEHSSTTVQDVGEEYVDVTARIATAKKLEERLVSLLATRTGRLEDVLAVERELARVRGEIERYEGRIRWLSTRVATSTILATVHERAPLVAAQPGENVIRRAVINMWRNFVLFIARAIEALGVLVPVAVMAWIAFVIWRRRLRATPSTT